MKKFLPLLLILAILLSVTACGNDTVSLDVGSAKNVGKDTNDENDAEYEDEKFAENDDVDNDSANTPPKDDGVFKIGVYSSSTGDSYATVDFGEDKLVRYNNASDAIAALRSGKVDAVISDKENAEVSVAGNKGLRILKTPYAVEEYVICFPKADTLNTEIDTALKELIADGSVKKIVDKYINVDGISEDIVGVPVNNTSTADKNLWVATNAEFAPYEYIDGDYYYGIDIEISKAIADKLGCNLIITNYTFDSIVLAVSAHKCEMGIAALDATTERAEAVDFSTPYFTSTQVVIVNENSAIKDIDDLEAYYVQ